MKSVGIVTLTITWLVAYLLLWDLAAARPLRVLTVVGGEGRDAATVQSTLQWLLKRHEEIRVTATKDWTPEDLQQVDVLLLHKRGMPMEGDRKQALQEFLQRGGGLVLLHASPAPSTVEGATGNVVVEVVQPRHPTLREAFAFQITDAPIQSEGTIPAEWSVLARQRNGKPLVWAQQVGKGRVFITALGHAPSAWANPHFQQAVLDAVYWCAGRKPPQPRPSRPPKGFVSLFNGVNLEGWGEVGPAVWSAQDGVIVCSGLGESTGWLRSNRMYRNFILRLEYRISPGGNSGIFLRAPHFGRSSRLGMELQIQDDGTAPPSRTCTSAVYSVVTPRVNPAKPAGEWNQVEVMLKDRHLRVVWNGQLVHDILLDDPTLNANLPRTHLLYRRPNWGYIGLQNHRSLVEFRNIFIKEIQ